MGQTLHQLLWSWAHVDALYYLTIATKGYPVNEPWVASFFPLYPLLDRGLGTLIGADHILVAGMLIANGAALAAFMGLGLLATQEYEWVRHQKQQRQQDDNGVFDDRASTTALTASTTPIPTTSAITATATAAAATLRLYVAYPLAFFLAAPWSDSLFAALAVFALYHMRRRHWGWAVACTFLATLARPTGVLLVLPLLWEYFGRQHIGWRVASWRQARVWWQQVRSTGTRARQNAVRAVSEMVMVVCVVPVALLLYAWFSLVHYGDPLAPLHNQRYFSHAFVGPWTLVALVWQVFTAAGPFSYEQLRQLVDILPLLAVLVITLVGARRRPVALTLYLAALPIFYYSAPITNPAYSYPLTAAGRYMLAAFPAFLDAGAWLVRHPAIERILLVACVVVQVSITIFYLDNGFMI
jgi:hypothetical protein